MLGPKRICLIVFESYDSPTNIKKWLTGKNVKEAENNVPWQVYKLMILVEIA